MLRASTFQYSIIYALSVLVAACAASEIEIQDDSAIGRPPLCAGSSADLGAIVVYPRTSWRPEQQEPARRAEIAASAISAAFRDFPCGRIAQIHPVDEPRDWHEHEIRAIARKAGIATVILIELRELGPQVEISAPAQWSGATQIRLRLRAVDAASGEPRLDVERRRTGGGSYGGRGGDALESETVAVLRDLIGASVAAPVR